MAIMGKFCKSRSKAVESQIFFSLVTIGGTRTMKLMICPQDRTGALDILYMTTLERHPNPAILASAITAI